MNKINYTDRNIPIKFFAFVFLQQEITRYLILVCNLEN